MWQKRCRVLYKTRKPSLEVAPTILPHRTRSTNKRNTPRRNKHTQPVRDTFSSNDRELWLITLTFELDLDRVKLNQPAIYLGQRSFRSKVIVRTQTNTHRTDCSTCTTETVGKCSHMSAIVHWESCPVTNMLWSAALSVHVEKCQTHQRWSIGHWQCVTGPRCGH